MNNDVGYEMAWRLLKNIIEQFKDAQTFVAQDAPNASEFDRAKGKTYMAAVILKQMKCIEEGLADAMR